MNKTILIIIIILVVIVGGYFLLRGGYQTPAPVAPEVTAPEETPEEVTLPPAPSGMKEVTVVGTEFSFSPALITVKSGEKVKLTFQNNGSVSHNLVVEGLGISTKTIGRGKTETLEFTAPASGTYKFFCSVPGHRPAGMEGSLKAE